MNNGNSPDPVTHELANHVIKYLRKLALIGLNLPRYKSTHMPILFVTFAICGAVSGTHLYGIIGESYHAPQPYKFGYVVKDKDSSQHRHEEGDGHGNVRGSYGYTDDKGQYREVHYVADKGGFRAQVKTNEAGTANQNPAHVEVKADPPHHHLHHEPHHHVPHVHHHIPLHHHVPHHHEVKIEHHVPVHHHIPHHHEVKIEHHVPVHHHIPHHHEIKIDHHAPLHHDFKNFHHHGFKGYHHFDSPLSSYKFDTFAPLHGFSYNPSAFHHGYGHWPFMESNNYDHFKHHGGFHHNGPHHNYHHGIGHGFNFGSDINGLSSFNKNKYEKIIEEIKKYRHQEPLNDFGGLKSHLFNEFDNGDYKHGL
ncbi:peptidoglycan-recognition protein SB2 [Trichonephila inaurata madagascariensis]|uniref:Peptidoglycan-recognition protein SB2 n=2 Tax=Trichonephila inaurata madagascariensis TaxID=2747483 RepID=A0A8X6XVV3_9ARAC|nr:peptidoglycan-recognition protein SB2 [Trichonephila inaurata madagascariensis]